MPSYKLVVEYNGARYNGFQRQTSTAELSKKVRPVNKKRPRQDERRQKGVPRTVQDCLEEALAQWTGLSIPQLRLRCSGRTDKGVHATGQVIAVDIEDVVLEEVQEWQKRRAINSRLPSDVSVKSIEVCEATFEPRLDAVRKEYTYTIRFRRLVVDKDSKKPLAICTSGPQTLRTAHDPTCLWICPWPLDDSHIHNVCYALAGKHDFSCFVHKAERQKRDNTLELSKFEAEYLNVSSESAPSVNLRFTLEACGFRRSMVRNLVGFAVDVCRGLASQDDIPKVLTGSNDGAAIVHAAPASGLCLAQVTY